MNNSLRESAVLGGEESRELLHQIYTNLYHAVPRHNPVTSAVNSPPAADQPADRRLPARFHMVMRRKSSSRQGRRRTSFPPLCAAFTASLGENNILATRGFHSKTQPLIVFFRFYVNFVLVSFIREYSSVKNFAGGDLTRSSKLKSNASKANLT